MREAIDVARGGSTEPAEVETPSGVDEKDDGGFAALPLGFLGTPAGQALNTKIADWIGAQNDGSRARHHRESTELHWRYGLMVLVIGTAAVLDSTIVGFLGLALGYLFGRSQKQE
ncbi:hypothetical protein [Anaeromyxobacter oryzisoli]|uniref:hypothetical protein n=1 Tax=Anaeromyxobacter oryzisoli TaxID=2925408 RepID=UPI001F55D5F6|nr:hypothetical protein [Anaeromyxobacter sp. SG63]